MSSMFRNNSTAALMGFSISQPAVGAPLQFFPTLGTKELNDLISAYVPGNAPITEKRAAVSMEFFQNAMATGEFFKFFMVPAYASVAPSPVMDSGYGSSFAASPASQTTSFSPPNISTPRDYSNAPGMRIMTRDGRDVTNLSSRGCKTKEQRDHAHLMRIIKACESCKKKKVKCDPSHKRPAAGSSGKVTKKASKNSRPAPMSRPAVVVPELNTAIESPLSSGSSSSIPVDTVGEGVMEWDQFIQFDDEPLDNIPVDYDFFMDPAGYFSPAGTSATFTSSNTSPSQLPPTPIDDVSEVVHPGTAIVEDESNAPMLPYLSENALESASSYVDFDLFSPAASPFLDEELSMARELSAALPRPNFTGRVSQQLPPHGRDRNEYPDDHSRRSSDNAVADSVNIAANLHFQSTSSSPLDMASYDDGHGGYQDLSTFRRQPSSVQAMSHGTSDGVIAPATVMSFNGVHVDSVIYGGVSAIETQSHAQFQRDMVPLMTSSPSDIRNSHTVVSGGATAPREERRLGFAFGSMIGATADHDAMAPRLPDTTSFDAFTRFTSAPDVQVMATEPERLSLDQPNASSNGVLSTSAAQRRPSDDASRLYERESIHTVTPARTDTGTPVQDVRPQTHIARNTIATNVSHLSPHQFVQSASQANGIAVGAMSAVSPQARLEGVRFDPRRIAATQPIVSTQQDRLVSSTFVLVLSLAAILLLISSSFVLMAAMSLGITWSQRNTSMRVSYQNAAHSPSSSTTEPTATGAAWNELYIDTIENVKDASVKLERIVRCRLDQKLQGWVARGLSASSASNRRKQTQTFRCNRIAV
ncbi:hypothetical protein F5Y18DRAFT_126196 [Xylariaceae sp. FL1019]|nr:hypothetical protein F5Y18DRAFT_126196 [Xylariaceae sp. FL1019]